MEKNAFGQPIVPLCFTRADDELLALGYPHLRRLVDGHKDDKNSRKSAALAANDNRSLNRNYRSFWPRKTAERFVRAARSAEFQNWMGEPTPDSYFAEGGPVSPDEARALIAATMKVRGCTFLPKCRDLFYVLEAMVGTELVVDAILDGLEALPDRSWTQEKGGPDRKTGEAAFLLGFLFLRLTERSRAERRARLRTIFDLGHTLIAKAGTQSFELVDGIDMVLEGSRARKCANPGPYTYLFRYLHAGDDVDKLRALIASKDAIYGALDVRLVYLCGPEVLGTLGKHKPAASEVLSCLGDIGMIRHELVVDRMLEWVGKPSAKDAPLMWFREHAEFAKPFLERRKSASAQMMLRALSTSRS
jgi:hypothetical protein